MSEPATSSSRPRVLSGMRPTGKLHLGNYMGALANWVKLQDQYECYFFIADLHALTTDYADTSQIAPNTLEVASGFSCRRPRSRAMHHLRAEPREAALRTAAAAGNDYAAGLAGARAQLQGDAGEPHQQGPDHLWIPGLPGPDGVGHPALPAEVCARGAGPAGARGADPRNRAALQPVLQTRMGAKCCPSRKCC